MMILILCKRRPQNRDLLERPFGRFHHLPAELARHGHRVTVLLASYANEPDACVEREGVTVRSISVRGAGAARYLALARRLVRSERPDWIGGLSDTWYAVLAAQLARRAAARADLLCLLSGTPRPPRRAGSCPAATFPSCCPAPCASTNLTLS
jgi:hypothetical protein